MNRSAGSARVGGRRVPAALIAVATASLLLTACGGQDTSASQTSPGQNATAGAAGGATPGSGTGQAVAALDRSVPQEVSIPSLGVSSALETLGQSKDGVMTTPKNPDLAGWYEPGPTPGSQGPAVIAGHVTWNGADAVFKGLKTLTAGDKVEVKRQDGKTATFTVDRVEEYPKKEFPTLEVYKNLDHAGLRLVTCGGEFDADRHYYPNNVVVFASMTGVA
ncbi:MULTISPECIES: class F sortase [Streptomyces]|uniref:Class F sortase n=1 Tax=Streptomyces koelreuteriae TaxID=2838015 RepID=A0ABX8FJD9_9ACTN|nr:MULTISPECIES: class F sortase [Streptomyces]QWB21236.1 class F sortase [Streptomyces koelreuteriae]UUA04153.1 class F sortase [Streptomyces koelreuteriae]UUA11779.1 class F sortase [Streptomyces sp. CRCS-T-1]